MLTHKSICWRKFYPVRETFETKCVGLVGPTVHQTIENKNIEVKKK